jgi:hypothetical protein
MYDLLNAPHRLGKIRFERQKNRLSLAYFQWKSGGGVSLIGP